MVVVRPDRLGFAKVAALRFLRQEWPHLHLVVFNATGRSLKFPRMRRFTEIALRAMDEHEMLNLCLHNADGQYCTLLRDDTFYGPHYVSSMMEHAQAETLVLLRRKIRFSVKSGQGELVDDDRIFCPLFARNHPARFVPDGPTAFADQFMIVKRAEGPINSVVRFTQ